MVMTSADIWIGNEYDFLNLPDLVDYLIQDLDTSSTRLNFSLCHNLTLKIDFDNSFTSEEITEKSSISKCDVYQAYI